jgi:hypothetical protein
MGVSDETMSIPSYAYTCAVCEVEVDPETGLVDATPHTAAPCRVAATSVCQGVAPRSAGASE